MNTNLRGTFAAAVVATLAFVPILQAQEPDGSAPPPETEQFARLAGIWQVKVWSRNPDGSWMENPVDATWRWETILNGHAVQDHWASPSQEVAGALAFGTNVRIYDPEAGHWKVSWTASDDRDFMELTARQEGEELRVYGMHDSGVPLRITFHELTDETFRWRMEIPSSRDGSWITISRMEARRSSE